MAAASNTPLCRVATTLVAAAFLLAGCGTSELGAPAEGIAEDSVPLFLDDLGAPDADRDAGAAKGGNGKKQDKSDSDSGDADSAGSGEPGEAETKKSKKKVTTVVEVDGAVGGTVTAGRFTVVFPPGAFSGTETITVKEKPGAIVECSLKPHGIEFDVPVTLIVDLLWTTGDDDRTTIFWRDEVTKTWVDVGGEYSPEEHTVSTELDHFSRYRPGRGGW